MPSKDSAKFTGNPECASGPGPARDSAVDAFLARHPQRPAAATLTGPQAWREAGFAVVLFAFCLYDWKAFAAVVLFALAAFYAAIALHKLLIVLVSCLLRPVPRFSADELTAFRDEELPVYTVLIPMYREAEVAAKLVHAVAALEYPADKLDVKLLLEADDRATIDQCLGMALPRGVEVMVVAHSLPKTKPKACNHGLWAARGEFLVVYDAEDRPEPDQLRKAVALFRRLPARVVCLQARLNYHNPRQNWLTRFFTLEYTAWFDLFLPGLVACGAPIPLGGTSNHFRIDALRRLGGWDPFNLTEDCDLGLRLHRGGYRTQMLDSTTWEEANSRVGNWIRQRSRWVKGYLQTHFVHTRSYGRTLVELGPWGTAHFLLTVGGQSAAQLLNPLFWLAGLAYAGLAAARWAGAGPGPWRLVYDDRVADLPGAPLTAWSEWSQAFWYMAVGLFFANGLFIGVNMAAVLRRRLWDMTPQALLSPLYWALGSAAAWKGFLQLFSRPYHWEKTLHGLDAPGLADASPKDPARTRSATHESALGLVKK